MRHRTKQPPLGQKNTGGGLLREHPLSALDRTSKAIRTSRNQLNQTEWLVQFGKHGHSNLAKERGYERIVDDAVVFMRSDYASVQIYFQSGDQVANCGCWRSGDSIPMLPSSGSGYAQIRKVLVALRSAIRQEWSRQT
jgi:hypothetical protein